jgi:uncharacterized protein (DUF1800 family)
MNLSRKFRKPLIAVALIAGSLPFAVARKKDIPAANQMDEHKRVVHALNRLTFGPRPGDIERVSALGVDKWIDEQLHPEKIADGPMQARLAAFPTLDMSTQQLMAKFPPPEIIRGISNGKLAMPSDPVEHAIYQAQLQRYELKQERKQQKLVATSASTGDGASLSQQTPIGGQAMTDEEITRRQEDRLKKNVDVDKVLTTPPHERVQVILAMPTEDQIALASALKGPKRDDLVAGLNPQDRETVFALNNPMQLIGDELMQAKLIRAIYSERQLQEVMVDFWMNHFNVFIGKEADRYLLTSYERDTILPHSMGKFEDLLVATAKSPAMLFYLDNWLSEGPNSDAANGIGKPRNNIRNYDRRRNSNDDWRRRAKQNGPVKVAKGKRNGLNENYGREVMELQTLGVNGGYTQKDVTEVARVLTGWTLKEPKEGRAYTFDERKHEPGDKMVLGHRIKPKGEKEGLEVLHILAHHPATAKFICTKLAIRFVSDNPPPALVERMAQTFLKKDGDIREVLTTLFHSQEFWEPESYRAKVKTPLEFVVSAARASGAQVDEAGQLAHQLQTMGMPLYGMQPPTGYSMKADAWVNSSALLGRMNFALALTNGKLKGVKINASEMLGQNPPTDTQQQLAIFENSLLAGDVSKQTNDTITARLEDPALMNRKQNDASRSQSTNAIAGLILGSPEFQRR